MKPSDFINTIKESTDEADTVRNSIQTILRVASHLEKDIGHEEDFPEWVSEKIGAVKENLVTIMDYVISQHELSQQEQLPGFDPRAAEAKFNQGVTEEYDDEDTGEGFFVVISNERGGSFVGMINMDGGKWRETAISGRPPANWGEKSYMSYMLPQDIMSYMYSDYGRRYEVKGPFFNEHEAMQYAEYMSEGRRTIKENATGGATGASSMAVSMTQGGNYPTEMVERQKHYTNQRTKGGPVKVKGKK